MTQLEAVSSGTFVVEIEKWRKWGQPPPALESVSICSRSVTDAQTLVSTASSRLLLEESESSIRAVANHHLRVGTTLAVALALLSGCGSQTESSGRRVGVDRPDMPLEALTAEEVSRFNEGDALFEVTFRESDGLGPLFIRDACSACHQGDGRGPGSVTKMALGGADPALEKQLLPFGSTARPYVTAGAKVPLLFPTDQRVRVTSLLPPSVWGRGYLEAVSSAEIERLAREAAARSGPIRGRLHRLPGGEIGRFGLKARIASLREFTAEALYGDMGITSPLRPTEASAPEGLTDDRKPGVDVAASHVDLLASYVRLLAMPARSEPSPEGRALFEKAECATCHVPSLATSKTSR